MLAFQSGTDCEVRRALCNHEVEFGYSDQERGGRIWPVESSDFNPWLMIPKTQVRAGLATQRLASADARGLSRPRQFAVDRIIH